MSLRRCSALLAASLSLLAGCSGSDAESGSDDITDVPQTDVEQQAIGNCWLYARASWVESMHLAATGEAFDTSQSYWTYWHWYDQLVAGHTSQIDTGGVHSIANDLALDRGIMPEAAFVEEDTASEMSARQARALERINAEMRDGRLAGGKKRDPKLVREALDQAWDLSAGVAEQLTSAFGEDGTRTFRRGGEANGTSIIPADAFEVAYTVLDGSESTTKTTNLEEATKDWRVAGYPQWGWSLDEKRRKFQVRIQRALHDAQPVLIVWNVDFNAMETSDPELAGSFNLTTLTRSGGPGHQGGHMTVLEDYEAETQAYGVLEAGVTLDPSKPDDRAKLDAALELSTKVKFFRIKNSWGTLRDDRSSAPGFPGYHDLYTEYLNGPIAWCPNVPSPKTEENCSRRSTPWLEVVLPPGY